MDNPVFHRETIQTEKKIENKIMQKKKSNWKGILWNY